jgi:hypothetical protein
MRRIRVLMFASMAFLGACSQETVAWENVVGNWGGRSQLSNEESACLKNRPRLAAAIRVKDLETFLEKVAQVPDEELACFGNRVVFGIIPEVTPAGKCWRSSYLAAWALGVRQGEKYYSNTMSKAGPAVLKKCGHLGR